MNKTKKWEWIRRVVQLAAFLVVPSLFSQAFRGAKNILIAMGQGKPLNVDLFLITLCSVCALTIVFGRFFCGWLCAFGTLGDYLYAFCQWIRKKTGKRLPKIPAAAEKAGRYFKYVVLLLLLILCFGQKDEWITKYSPWTAFSFLTAGNLKMAVQSGGILALVLIIVGMCFKERFFCEFICPLGAVFSFLPRLPFGYLKRGKNCREGCQACRSMCPVSIKLQEDPLKDGECIACMRCRNICPQNNISFQNKK